MSAAAPAESPAMPVAIFGGTFDPIHHGHLRVAWEVAEQVGCEVRLLPSALPPHRAAPGADGDHRAAMIALALAGQERLRLDRHELDRKGPSYSVDTLAQLRTELGPDRPLLFILGADAFRALPSWQRWRELTGLAHLLVMTRPRQRLDRLDPDLHAAMVGRWTGLVERLRSEPSGRVMVLRVTPLAISSSLIRAALTGGRSPRYLLPEAVLDYLQAHGLYRGGRGESPP
jgi:nicotinate-nucleotide adenylyltransferase